MKMMESKMNELRICIDMDGIIANFNKEICSHHGVLEQWDIDPVYSCIPRDLFWNNVGFSFWYNMEKTPEADAIINLVIELVDYDQICILTLFPLKFGYPLEKVDDYSKGKMLWLKKYYPNLLTHFNLITSKKFCSSPNSILIDDYDSNIKEFEEEGGKGILFPRPWNRLKLIKEGYKHFAMELRRYVNDYRNKGRSICI